MDRRKLQALHKNRQERRRKALARVFRRPGSYQVFYGPDDDADVVHVEVAVGERGRVEVTMTESTRPADINWSAKEEG
jgi:hypothetical protein